MQETGEYATPAKRSNTLPESAKKERGLTTRNTGKKTTEPGGKKVKQEKINKPHTTTEGKTTQQQKLLPPPSSKAKKALPSTIVNRELDNIVRQTGGESVWKQMLSKKGLQYTAAALAAFIGAHMLRSDNDNVEYTNEPIGGTTPGASGDIPQLVNNFETPEETIQPVVVPATPSATVDPLATPGNNTATATESNNGSSATTSEDTSGANPAEAPQQAAPPVAPSVQQLPVGYLLDRRGVRRALSAYGDGAYGSNVYELVKGLENTPDDVPFKQALMNRLGMSQWDSNVAYNRLAELGITGYIGGSDRRRLRNLINSGTNISGEIIQRRNGGRLKLVKRPY